MSDDRYTAHVHSEAYREERARKADVIYRLVGDRLEAAESIADLGAGTGLIKRALEARTGKRICGFELDLEFVVDASGVVGADAGRLPVRDASFDFLILNHLYEHVEDQPALFREAYRILRQGGSAYVSAGNRLAVMEPHYRLPFLSWLPRGPAGVYLRASGRGESYEDIDFRTYTTLMGMMREAGFRVRDITEDALGRLLEGGEGGAWRIAWRALSVMPRSVRESALRRLSPQWFFLLDRE